jgi:hypothetical protein
MRARGRPVLGVFMGFFFGTFLAFELLVLGTLSLDSVLLLVIPIAGLVFGIVWAFAGPLGPRQPPEGMRKRA